MVALGDVTNLYQPKTITSKEILESGPYKVFGANGVIGYFTEYNHEAPEVLITCRGATCGTVNMSEPKSWVTGNAMVAQPKDERLDRLFLYYFLKNNDLARVISGSAQPQITRRSLAPFQIPLPPIEVQKEIVAEIEAYQKIIDGARLVVENYHPRIPIDPAWPMVELSDAADFSGGFAFKSSDMVPSPMSSNFRQVVKIGNVGRDGTLDLSGAQYHEYSAALERFSLNIGDIVIAMTGATVGKVAEVDQHDLLLNQRVGVVRANSNALQRYLFNLLRTPSFYDFCQHTAGGGAQGNIAPREILRYKIPIPDLDIQHTIVAKIEEEQRLVDANKELIRIFEEKIRQTINRIWDGSG